MNPTVSEGTMCGKITKLARAGLFWKTYEGEMMLGGMKTYQNSDNQTQIAVNAQQFTVTDESIRKDLEKKLHTGECVCLKYNISLFWLPWNGATTRYVNGIDSIV